MNRAFLVCGSTRSHEPLGSADVSRWLIGYRIRRIVNGRSSAACPCSIGRERFSRDPADSDCETASVA